MKISKPLLSVIVANHNNAPYLRDCLNSILDQSFKDLEIIVFEDNSTDESMDVIKDYEKKYPGIVRVISSPAKKGVAFARHEAILSSRAEYITTLDSDDFYFDTHKLEKEVEMIQNYKKNKNQNILAFSNIVLVGKDRGIIGFLGNRDNIKQGRIVESIISRACMIPRDFIMKKDDYFSVNGYDFSLKTHEDWDLKIRLASVYDFFYTGINGTAYRQHSTGLSSIPHHQRTGNLWQVFYKNIKLIPKGSRRKIKKIFYKFMVNRDRQFTDRHFRYTLNSGGMRMVRKWLFLYFFILTNFLNRLKGWIKR